MSHLNTKMTVTIIVARMEYKNGAVGSGEVFDLLEIPMDYNLQGRELFGVFYPQTNEYFASVALKELFPDIDLKTDTIPGGKYATKKIKDWLYKTKEITPTFQQLKTGAINSGYEIDADRPYVEFYKRFDELVIWVPIK